MYTSEEFQEGKTLLLDKPIGWTSFDVVKKLRNTIRVKKIGHAGTLDPLATGLLIICTGRNTKKIDTYQNLDKTYEGTITLGKTTPSYDLETAFDSSKDCSHIRAEEIMDTSRSFLGLQQQTPPVYSAIKVNGERSYKQARKQKAVKQLEPRNITINEFEILTINLPSVSFRINCSKGTYIRTIAHDMGQKLAVGGYLSSLRRTKIGSYNVKDAWQIDDLIDQIKSSYADN